MTNKNRKIEKNKTELKEGIEMNEKDCLNSILDLEKSLSNQYSLALDEASNDYLYEDYFELFEDSKDISREIYNYIFEKGWYSIEKESESKIQNKINEFCTKLDQLEE
ncbi:MAG: spore coat protein [Firmicutes bacterium]|nr:spore coat protein [Bacillota bacterium]